MTIAEMEQAISAQQPKNRLSNKPVSFCILRMKRDDASQRWGLLIQAEDSDKRELLYFGCTERRDQLFILIAAALPLHHVRLERKKLGEGKSYYRLADSDPARLCACQQKAKEASA